MSYAAIYEVTRALRMLLQSQLVDVSASSIVTLLPPGEALPVASGVNLYLYRVLESPFTKNQPWPGDRRTAASNMPPLGLQLYYLLTPLGTRPDETSFTLGDDAHTMLGAAMSTLYRAPGAERHAHSRLRRLAGIRRGYGAAQLPARQFRTDQNHPGARRH